MGEEVRLLRAFHKRLTNVTREATAVFANRIEDIERINAAEELAERTKSLTTEAVKTMDEWCRTRTDDEISWLCEQNLSGTIINALEDMLDTMPVHETKDCVNELSSTVKDTVISEPTEKDAPTEKDEPTKVSLYI